MVKETKKKAQVQESAEVKEEKRTLTWTELTKSKVNPVDKEGNPFTLAEGMNKSLRKDGITMAAKWDIRTLGYHVDPKGKLQQKKDSHFSRNTGTDWKSLEAVLEQDNQGRVITISGGSYKNHYIFLVPFKPIEAINHATGKKFTITPDNFLDHYQIFSNHGRAYRVAQFFAYQFKLLYYAIPRGKYTFSNPTNLNFEMVEDKWVILTKQGIPRPIENHPLDVLEDIKNGGDLVEKLINNHKVK